MLKDLEIESAFYLYSSHNFLSNKISLWMNQFRLGSLDSFIIGQFYAFFIFLVETL